MKLEDEINKLTKPMGKDRILVKMVESGFDRTSRLFVTGILDGLSKDIKEGTTDVDGILPYLEKLINAIKET